MILSLSLANWIFGSDQSLPVHLAIITTLSFQYTIYISLSGLLFSVYIILITEL